MALALNNPWRLIILITKKPSEYIYICSHMYSQKHSWICQKLDCILCIKRKILILLIYLYITKHNASCWYNSRISQYATMLPGCLTETHTHTLTHTHTYVIHRYCLLPNMKNSITKNMNGQQLRISTLHICIYAILLLVREFYCYRVW